VLYIVLTTDNRIYNSKLNSPHQLRRRKCPQFSRALRKTGCYWAEENTTSQLHRCARAEVNKFLLAYVILFKHVYFRRNSACLRERIFNCCNVLLSSSSSRSNSGGYLHGYLRDYRPKWTPFFRPFPVAT